ncbi:MAG: 23S rRNA (guanosine(2251)-2'-O)-methyltransferase RlmB [Elusimicrobia bacterium]|nr:23S rRNA (guanosine(2251)-2'-O)-methyltransferase RlmB [Elusimicrobiota bacterium]
MIFPICGKHAVFEALAADRPYRFERILMAQSKGPADDQESRIMEMARRKKIQIQKTDFEYLDRWAPAASQHQGVVLLLSEPPLPLSYQGLIHETKESQDLVLLALDQVQDHQNIGALTRTAICFGAAVIMAPEDRSAPLIHPSVWRVAQGAAEHVRFAGVPNLARALDDLKDNDCWIVGAVAEGGQDPRVLDWPKKVCLVLGGEEKGLRRLTEEKCDFKVTLPHSRPGGLDSLNVSYAASILLWEIYRRRL